MFAKNPVLNVHWFPIPRNTFCVAKIRASCPNTVWPNFWFCSSRLSEPPSFCLLYPSLSLFLSLSPSLPLSLSLFLSLSCFSDRITFAIAGNQFRGSFLPNDRLGRRLGYLDIALLSDRKFSILLLKPSCLSEVAVDSQHSVNGLLQEPFKDLDTTLSIATKS